MVMRTPVLSGRRESIGGKKLLSQYKRVSEIRIGEPICKPTATTLASAIIIRLRFY
jgi:hypothetical protein